MESKERPPGPHINLKPIYSITYWHMELSTKAKAEMKNHAPFVCKAFFTIKTMLGCCVKTGFQSFVRPNLDQFWQTAKQLNKLRFQGNILACLGIVTDSFFLIVFFTQIKIADLFMVNWSWVGRRVEDKSTIPLMEGHCSDTVLLWPWIVRILNSIN